MKTRTNKLFAVFALLLFAGCEVPAASGTVEVTIENLSTQDIDNQGRLLFAIAAVNSGACVEGPCSPNPCLGDPQGKSACIGQGDAHMCICPPGMHEDTEGGTGNCVADMACLATTCNRGGVGTCADEGGVLSCTCIDGYSGPNCTECDPGFGFFPDGLGGCTIQPAEVCREGQGAEAFQKLLADAEEELGHTPTELELSSARMELVAGTAKGVRSWDYLFRDRITLFMQTVSGFPQNAGRVDVPPADQALEALEFDMDITRDVTSGDPQFKSGDFRVGISGATDRLASEEFAVDVKLVLDFNAY